MPMKLRLHLTIILSKLVALSLKVTNILTKLTSKRLKKKLSRKRLFLNLDPSQPIEVFNVINSLNPHEATGYNDISSYFLRIGNKILVPVLSLFFECVFELGVFPQIFKAAKVVPIHKSGSKHLVRNYCSISLPPSTSKVLEKLIKH